MCRSYAPIVANVITNDDRCLLYSFLHLTSLSDGTPAGSLQCLRARFANAVTTFLSMRLTWCPLFNRSMMPSDEDVRRVPHINAVSLVYSFPRQTGFLILDCFSYLCGTFAQGVIAKLF